MGGNICFDYFGNYFMFIGKFFFFRDFLLGEIFIDSNFGSFGNCFFIFYELKNVQVKSLKMKGKNMIKCVLISVLDKVGIVEFV